MNQDQTYGHKGQGPGKSFLVLMRFLSYQLVHLLVHTNNGKVMFYHTSAVERGVMGDGQNVLAPRLARERAWGTIERMMNFDAPSDLTRFLQIDLVEPARPISVSLPPDLHLKLSTSPLPKPHSWKL